MSPSTLKRELRRAAAKRDRLANESAEAVSAGVAPAPDAVARWQYFSMRVFALERNLRPRECGAALGDRTTEAAHVPAVEVSDGSRAPDAAPNPAPFPTNPQPQHQP